MTRIHPVILCAVVIVLVITAGCTSGTSNPPVLITTTPASAETPAAVTTAATQPGAAGTQASGTCTANINTDPANCGGCGYACPANALCSQGQCFCKEGFTVENNACVASPAGTSSGNGCPSGMSPCPDGYCYELSASAANCGMCGNACPSGMTCSASTCTAIPADVTTVPVTTTAAVTTTGATTSTTTSSVGSGLTLVGGGGITASKACLISGKTMCDGSCVNLSTSTTNCGTCGKVCKSLAPSCCNGNCVNYQTDEANCGSCGHKCLATATCEAGSCKFKSLVTYKVVTTVPKISLAPVYQKPGLPGF